MAIQITTAFEAARQGGRRAALIPFFMGGFPSVHGSREIGEAYADAGADVVELGVPSAQALADGPVIRAAGAAAIRAGATLDGVLDVARAVSSRVPVVVMCYAHVVLANGTPPFAEALRDAGVSGLIVPDLPVHETPALLDACDASGVALVPLIAPTTPEACVAEISARARGFIYTVSTGGRTGEREALPANVAALIRRAKLRSTVPVALGFGISTPEQAAQAAAAGADGVIVGSRLVRAAAEAADPATAVSELVAQLAKALGRRTVTSVPRPDAHGSPRQTSESPDATYPLAA
jgi:tryptophan synthase alpha chain